MNRLRLPDLLDTGAAQPAISCEVIVTTERLGWPDPESSRLERSGILQRRMTYPNEPEVPTALCHLQPSDEEPALCGYPWEGLIRVPGAVGLDDVLDEDLRCARCQEAATATTT